jgi:xylose isomerase
MKCCDVLPNLFSRQEYIKRLISSGRPEVVKQAKDEIRDVVDITRKIGGSLVNIWAARMA